MQLSKRGVVVFVEDGLSFYGFSPGKILTFDKFFVQSKRGFVCLYVYGTVNCMMVRSLSSGKGVSVFSENTLVFVDVGQRETILSLVLSATILLGSSTSVVLNDASAQKVVYADQHDFTCLIVVGFVMYCSVDSFHKVSAT
jgi:hypothetical protein